LQGKAGGGAARTHFFTNGEKMRIAGADAPAIVCTNIKKFRKTLKKSKKY